MITASALERVAECAASVALPQTPYTGPEAVRGTDNHEQAEAGVLHPRLARFVGELHDLQHEVSFVLDTKARTVRTSGVRRAYGHLSPHEIGTTPDVIGVCGGDKGDVAVALDYKSHRRVTRAERNWQVRSHALAASSLLGGEIKRVWAGIGYLDTGDLDIAEFSPVSLGAAWVDLHEVCDRVERVRHLPVEQLTPRRGPWCEYCPALLSCPAQKTALASFMRQADISEAVANATPEQIDELRTMLRTFEQLSKQATDALRMRVAREPIPLPNGKVLRLIEITQSRLSTGKMQARLSELGENLDDYKISSTYTKLQETKQ